MTIDWEDFGQLYCKYIQNNITPPSSKAIERQTDIILQLLSDTDVKATFFILGLLAKYRPELVKKISDEGHEIALHGMNHESLIALDRNDVRRDISDSKKLVSDIVGAPIFGYRAPFFSIVNRNTYVLQLLAELGFQYDSSIFPSKMTNYGIDGFDHKDTLYKLPNGLEIVEIPLTVLRYAGKNWPVAGGGYMRIMPMFMLKYVYLLLKKNGKDCIIYMHPYEFDIKKIDVSVNLSGKANISRAKISLLNLRWNFLRRSIIKKLNYILTRNSFSTCIEKSNHVKSNTHSAAILGRP